MPSKGRSLTAAALVVLVASACGAFNTIKARQLAREGNALYRSSDFRGAIAKYRQAIELDPATPNVYLNLGYSLFSIYDPQSKETADRDAASEAIKAFDAHLKQAPKDEKAMAFRIKILLRAAPNDPAMADRAFELFKDLLAQNPKDAEARQFLVTLFIDCKRYRQALEYFQAALEKNPDDIEIMKILGIIAEKSGETQEAINWYRRRAETVPDTKAKASLFYELSAYVWKVLQYQPDKAMGAAALRLADQGIEASRRAMSLKEENAEAMVYANLLYLKRALYEPLPVGRRFDETIADDLRAQGTKIINARKEKEGGAHPAAANDKEARATPPAAASKTPEEPHPQ